MTRKYFGSWVTALALLLSTQAADASMIVGSQAMSYPGRNPVITLPTTKNITTATSFGFPTMTLGASSGNFLLYTGPGALVSTTLSTANYLTYNFSSAGFGTFQTTAFVSDVTTLFAGITTRIIKLNGTITPGTGPSGAYAVLSPNTGAVFILSLNQAGGTGSAISASSTLQAPAPAPPLGIPEPGTMVLAIVGLIPLAIAARRRAV